MKKKHTLQVLLIAAMLVLTACGGDGGETKVEPTPEPEQRPYRAFVLNQEEEVETSFFDITEEHLYQFTVNNPSVINIESNPHTAARYHEADTNGLNDVTGGLYYTVFDEDSNVIGNYNVNVSFGSTGSFQSYDIGILQPGLYYLIVNFPLAKPGQEHKTLNSLSGDKNYDLLVTHYNIAEDIHGTEDVDILRGDDSDQTIYGYSGKDKLYGEAGSDIIYGGEGDDLIHGGIGADDLTGGEGQDIFLYASIDESTFNLTERDIIRDFAITEDFIDISSLVSSSSSQLTPSKYFNGSEPDTSTNFGMIWFNNGFLYVELDNYFTHDPSYDFVIELEGVTSLPVERIIFP
jgi:Ca2+-binding RTX toxin-like protein